jgi:hypothetical protein
VSQELQPRGLRIPQAAAYAGLAPWRVEVLVRSGQLPAIKPSRYYIILKEELDTFLDQQKAVRP